MEEDIQNYSLTVLYMIIYKYLNTGKGKNI